MERFDCPFYHVSAKLKIRGRELKMSIVEKIPLTKVVENLEKPCLAEELLKQAESQSMYSFTGEKTCERCEKRIEFKF